MKMKQRILSVFLCLVIATSMLVAPPTAHADLSDALDYSDATIKRWLGGENILFGGWNPVSYLDSLFSVNQPKKYYTTPTSSTVDRSGNVTNYYRSGDTTNNSYKEVGNVTNVYYYELEDGRNSSTLTASEVAGIDLKYDVKNYDLITDDPNTLSLQVSSILTATIPTVPAMAGVIFPRSVLQPMGQRRIWESRFSA